MEEGAEIHTCLLSCVFRSGLDDTRLPYFFEMGSLICSGAHQMVRRMAYRPWGLFCFLLPTVRIAGVCHQAQVFYVGPGDRTQLFEVSAKAFTGKAASVAPPTLFRWNHRNAWHSLLSFPGGIHSFHKHLTLLPARNLWLARQQ